MGQVAKLPYIGSEKMSAQIELGKKMVGKMKEVQLTFHNLNQNTVLIYVKNGLADDEERVKTMLPMAMYTVEKGKAFAYQEEKDG